MGFGQYDGNSTFIDGITSYSPLRDAFGRLRICSPETIFDTTFRWDKQPITWSESTASGGTVTHNSNKASVELAVTTTTNSTAIFQSRQYTHYHPGKSQLIVITGNFIANAANVVKKIGYYDDDNGVFFQLSGSTLSVVRRTKTSGSVVDNVINQADWNIDKLDGTGASDITIDITKQQIFVIDFQWLGSGRIRYGFDIGGVIVYCHEELSSNVLTLPWSQTGDAPIRAELKNNSATAASMHITCCAIVCENFWSPEGILRTINNGQTARSISGSSTVPIISLRKQSAYVNVPVKIVDTCFFANSADDLLISIVYNGTLTSPSWSNVSGVCQQDVSATAISGGETVYSSYLRGAAGASSFTLTDVFREVGNTVLGRDIAGNSDIVSLVVTNVTAGTTSLGAINYRELL